MKTEELIELMRAFDASGLSALSWSEGESRIAFSKRQGSRAPTPTPVAGVAAPPTAEAIPAPEYVTSPIVGHFYRSPAPDAPPLTEAGSRVRKGQALCIIESMKVMNELTADFACEIVAVLAENGSMVQYGTRLFEVRKP